MDSQRVTSAGHAGLLRATQVDHPSRAVAIHPPRFVRRRTAIVMVVVLTSLALFLGAGAAELTARASSTDAPRVAATATPTPTRDLGICGSDVPNLFATIARMPGDLASEVMTHLSSDYAAAIDGVAMTTTRDALQAAP